MLLYCKITKKLRIPRIKLIHYVSINVFSYKLAPFIWIIKQLSYKALCEGRTNPQVSLININIFALANIDLKQNKNKTKNVYIQDRKKHSKSFK